MQAQEIFRKVIEAGHYGCGNHPDEFMCCALAAAKEAGTVTDEEREFAQDAINTYMDSLELISGRWTVLMCHALRVAFDTAGPTVYAREWAPVQGREFYLTWDQRPMERAPCGQ